ncbi:MAG: hypothetical protein V1778_01635 [bacterium]
MFLIGVAMAIVSAVFGTGEVGKKRRRSLIVGFLGVALAISGMVVMALIRVHLFAEPAAKGVYTQRIPSFGDPIVQEFCAGYVFAVSEDAPVDMAPIPFTQLVVVRRSDDMPFRVCTDHPELFAAGDTVRVYAAQYQRFRGMSDNFLYIVPAHLR